MMTGWILPGMVGSDVLASRRVPWLPAGLFFMASILVRRESLSMRFHMPTGLGRLPDRTLFHLSSHQPSAA